MPYKGECWVEDYYYEAHNYEAEMKEDAKYDLERFRRNMNEAYELYLLAAQRGLKDAPIRKLKYNDAVEVFENQKRFLTTFK